MYSQIYNILNTMLNKLSSANKYAYIMGDFNINVMNDGKLNLPSQEFSNILLFLPLIYKPTIITYRSATLIDNIYTNVSNIVFFGDIVY